MSERPSPLGIDELGEIDVEGTFARLAAGIENDGPVIRKGFKDVEARVGNATKLLWDMFSAEDDDWFGKYIK